MTEFLLDWLRITLLLGGGFYSHRAFLWWRRRRRTVTQAEDSGHTRILHGPADVYFAPVGTNDWTHLGRTGDVEVERLDDCDVWQCRHCHRPAVQWLDMGGMQTFGLCARHSTLRWQVTELAAALCDLKWALAEGILDGMTRASIKWRSLRRRWRHR